ncbi:MAG: PAS-domain containing protein [Anaerolineales bacterium]|nr:PAS-domain containing protein [Anaerolineales bacterium]
MTDAHIFLLTTDDEIGEKFSREILNPAGFRISRISDVLNLEVALQGDSPDLIIWDGRESSEDLPQLLGNFNVHHPNIPVILLWGEPSFEMARSALRGGCMDYIYPPFVETDVINIINNCLQRSRHLDQSQIILSRMNEGVLVISTEGRLIFCNQAARQFFELGTANLLGKPFKDVIQNPDFLELLEPYNQTENTHGEINLADGRVLNSQVSHIPEIGCVVTAQEITHLKELDRIKTDFVNAVSHDLRSPLTAILGYVELLERVGEVNPQQKEFIQRVRISVQSITALINDLLDLGRIEAGFDSHKEVTPLGAMVRYSLEGLSNTISARSQTLELNIPSDTPSVLGNPVRLRQMCFNLISNAIKYAPIGGTIRIQVNSSEDHVIMQVTDNGPGISPQDQPHIFDRFYRASNQPADASGTGLGLAIVKSIVEDHQGRVWVESSIGHGSTFTVVLPVVDRS